MRKRAISPATSAGVLLLAGILIGAAAFYSGFSLAGRTVTSVSTSVTTSTQIVQSTQVLTSTEVSTVTSTITSVVPPSEALVTVTGASFPSAGVFGTVTLYNSGAANTTIVSASLTYQGQTCSLAVNGTSIQVGPGSSTLDWNYVNGYACPEAPMSSGVSFAGSIFLSNGEQVLFAGTFQ